jgi:mannose-6-phosphate isomerase-like protein (cupin superfamily)
MTTNKSLIDYYLKVSMSDLLNQNETKFVPKGWGDEFWIVNNEKYCGKILTVQKDKRFSYHYHQNKEETFFLLSGSIMILYGHTDDIEESKTIFMRDDDPPEKRVFHIPVGTRHQVVAFQDSKIIEFSTTHADIDSIRIIKGD